MKAERARRISEKLAEIFKSSGLKVAKQKYRYTIAGNEYSGENVYAVLHAPRGDATEAIVLVAAWKNMEEQLNQSGVALALTLARYFKRMHTLLAVGELLTFFRMVVVVKRHHILNITR